MGSLIDLPYVVEISRDQFFTFQSDSQTCLCDISLHVDEIVHDISEYIIKIDLKTDTFDERVDGNLLNVYHYITNKHVSYDYANKITKIPLHFGPIIDKIYRGKITFQVFTTGSYKLLSIHVKKQKNPPPDLYPYINGSTFRKIHQQPYSDIIYCNKPGKLSVRFAFLIYVKGISFHDVSEIIIKIDGKKFCNSNKSTDLILKEIQNGILIFADVDHVPSIYHYQESDFTSYDDEKINQSSICVKTIDNTKNNRLFIHYFSYLKTENMRNLPKIKM